MSIVLILAGLFCWLVAFVVVASSQSAIHEIEAVLAFIAGILFLLSASLCDIHRAINASSEYAQQITKQQLSQLEDIAADLAWFKETKLTESREQRENRRSRA